MTFILQFMKQKRYDIIVGIDPDVDRSGVCVLSTSNRMIAVSSQRLPDLVRFVTELSETAQGQGCSFLVVVEAGWRNSKSCFHFARGKGVERIAKNVGANHQVGKNIIELLIANGVEVQEQVPLSKRFWGGNKVSHAQLSQFVDTLPSQTNQEQRDAILIAWHIAGFEYKF